MSAAVKVTGGVSQRETGITDRPINMFSDIEIHGLIAAIALVRDIICSWHPYCQLGAALLSSCSQSMLYCFGARSQHRGEASVIAENFEQELGFYETHRVTTSY